MRGLQNILQQSRDLVRQLLGKALGLVKTYMLYGLQGYTDLRPQQVFPANLFLCDIRETALHDGRGGKVSNILHSNATTVKELCENKVKHAYNAIP